MLRNKKEEHRLVLAWTLFIVYMVFLMYFLFFAEIMGRTYIDRDYHYNLTPFREIRRFIVYRRTLGWFAVLSNLLGNVLAFVPFGMILPMLTPKCRNFFHIVLLGGDFSLFVETIQLISKVGSFDVDDLILNTLGAALGYLVYRLIRRYFRRKHDDRKEKTL
ncbi:MAG: VanZ family protein [Lachnospiraceae bacterium]|nr:VanZ family protein [Lachnospiraceae bacterium]